MSPALDSVAPTSRLKQLKLLAILSLVLPLGSTVAPSTASPHAALPSPAGVLALAQRGLGSEYQATFEATGQLAVFPGPRWTVLVAHRGGGMRTSPTFGDGEWTFFLHAGGGYEVQWVEMGNKFADCWRTARSPRWHCSEGTYQPSNGFAMATIPYVTADVWQSLSQAVSPVPPARRAIRIFRRASSRFGALTCLTSTLAVTEVVPGDKTAGHPFVTTCLTKGGLPASQDEWGEGTWDHLGLVQLLQRAPAADFKLVGAPRGPVALPPL